MEEQKKGSKHILFICTGNICRSPTAEGVFRSLLHRNGIRHIEVDSAGTHGYHVGAPPDRRSQRTAAERGYDLSEQRARQLSADDFETSDLLVVMDEDNFRHVTGLTSGANRQKIRKLLEFAPHLGVRDVPDPYYGGGQGFELVLDYIEEACEGLLESVLD